MSPSCRKSCRPETRTKMGAWTSTSSPDIWRSTRRSCGSPSRVWTGTTMVKTMEGEQKCPSEKYLAHVTVNVYKATNPLFILCQGALMPQRSSSPWRSWAWTSAQRTPRRYYRGLTHSDTSALMKPAMSLSACLFIWVNSSCAKMFS